MGRVFPRVFAEAPLGLKSISFEAENALSAATATGQWAQPDSYGLDVVAALFFPLFLLGRGRNLRERGSGRGDLWLLLFRLFGFAVAPNLTFRHRNSPLRRLPGCEHSIIRSAVVSVKSRPIRSTAGAKNPISTHLHDAFFTAISLADRAASAAQRETLTNHELLSK